MKVEIERARQATACIEFERTLKRRPARFCWREPWTEPALHHEWRVLSYLLWRCRLWRHSGLGDFPGLKRMLRSTERKVRAARRAWEEEDKKERAEFLMSRTAAAEGLARYENEDE